VTNEPSSSNDGVTARTCPVCGTAYDPSGRRAYCSLACRQAAWRRCHAPPPPPVPVPPKGAKRAVTVYECDCGARALGAQYCEDCRTFMRAVGRGGLCPHCDLPVAVDDIVGGGSC
jgi:hypothetical protein